MAPGCRRRSDGNTDPPGSRDPLVFGDGRPQLRGLPAVGARSHAGSTTPDHFVADLRERTGHSLACVHGWRPAGIRDQRDHAAVRLRVRGPHRIHLCRMALGCDRRRLRRGCDPLSGSGQPRGRRLHLWGCRDRHPPGPATSRAVTPPRVLSGHGHHPTGRRAEAREGAGRRTLVQRPSGIDRRAPPRR